MKTPRARWLVVVTDDDSGDDTFYGPYTERQRDAVIKRAERWIARQSLDPDSGIPQWSVSRQRLRRWDATDD